MTTRGPAPKTTTQKKPATLESIRELLKKIVKIDGSSEEYAYEGLRLEVAVNHFYLFDDNGNADKTFTTLDGVEAELQKILIVVETAASTTIRNLTSSGEDAVIQKDKIVVGCRTVSFKKFDELVAAVTNYRAGK